jgi:hypothetical protein
MIGKRPAMKTQKIVIASALRETPVLHFALKRKRMAEINVPEWPIPIQKIKLVR